MVESKSDSFLAFDLGAESGRAMLGELRGDSLALRELHRFPNRMIEIDGSLHWDISGLFENVRQGLAAACAAEGLNLRSVGVDTWGVDFGLLAPDGSLLELPHAYRDNRTEGAVGEVLERIPAKRLYELTGCQVLRINTIFQLYSMVRDRSPLLAKARDLLFIPDLFNYYLTGAKSTEFTFATTSGLYNPLSACWEDELFDALGIPRTFMQDIVSPGAVIGALDEGVAREAGLDRLPVVAPATHDTGSAVAAVPALEDGWAFISSGTWSLMGVEVRKPLISEQARKANFTNEGGVGGTFRFLKNIMGLWLLQQCIREWEKERPVDYETLTGLASSAVPFAALINPDHGSFLNPPDMPEALRQFCRDSGQPEPGSPGGVTRCILESLALRYRCVLDELAQVTAAPVHRLHVIGGGARNRLLCQFAADATGLPVTAGPVEATAMGNILVQAMALGRISDVSELRGIVRRSFEVAEYEPDQSAQWERAYERFREIRQVP
jgi:rhamnulokinase